MKAGSNLKANEYLFLNIGKLSLSIHKLSKENIPWYRKWIFFTKENNNPNHIFSGSFFWFGWYYGGNVLKW